MTVYIATPSTEKLTFEDDIPAAGTGHVVTYTYEIGPGGALLVWEVRMAAGAAHIDQDLKVSFAPNAWIRAEGDSARRPEVDLALKAIELRR